MASTAAENPSATPRAGPVRTTSARFFQSSAARGPAAGIELGNRPGGDPRRPAPPPVALPGERGRRGGLLERRVRANHPHVVQQQNGEGRPDRPEPLGPAAHHQRTDQEASREQDRARHRLRCHLTQGGGERLEAAPPRRAKRRQRPRGIHQERGEHQPDDCQRRDPGAQRRPPMLHQAAAQQRDAEPVQRQRGEQNPECARPAPGLAAGPAPRQEERSTAGR